jgi:5'-deoxynucleotidase YfbR-like HD superfamily hydrolase
MTSSEASPRAWQRMLSGRRLDLLAPNPHDIEIVDIAHGLARVARWNGQTVGEHAFSVAQHSLLVERLIRRKTPDAPRGLLMAALLHDAPEYVIGDLISPFKAALGVDYKAFELRLLAAIHIRFDLPDPLPVDWTHAIKTADRAAAWWEATRLAGFGLDEARVYFDPQEDDRDDAPAEILAPWPTARAQADFLLRFRSVHPI